jgi:hypothetical protein
MSDWRKGSEFSSGLRAIIRRAFGLKLFNLALALPSDFISRSETNSRLNAPALSVCALALKSCN